MNAGKSLSILSGLLLLPAAHAFVLDDHAKALLLRSMQHAYNVNVRAVVDQRCTETNVMQQVRIEQTRSGKSRYTILQPQSDCGVESVDDGMRAITYLPDRKVVLVQASSRGDEREARKRLNLAEHNYKLTWVPARRIAGRATVCITATPRSPGLEKRKFYIDSQTAYLLRFETVSPGGKSQIKYDTKSIAYPSDMEEPGVSAGAIGVSTVTYEKQANLQHGRAARQLGFEPLMPRELPYGFIIQESKVTKSETWRAVAVRITDGLVRGTVYEWQPSERDEMGGQANDRSVLDAQGLRLMLVADMPAAARERILEAFAQGRSVSLRQTSETEPTTGSRAFKNLVGRNSKPTEESIVTY